MKLGEITKGMLVSHREFPDIVWGKIIDVTTGGNILVESFAQNTRHFMSMGKFVAFPVVIEPDGDEYHGYAPTFKGLHVPGKTVEETKANLEDAARAYLQSMLNHGEIRFNGNTRRFEKLPLMEGE